MRKRKRGFLEIKSYILEDLMPYKSLYKILIDKMLC